MRTPLQTGRFGLIPLLILCGSGWLGYLIAQWAFHHFGWVGGVLGFIGGFSTFLIIVMLLGLLERRLLQKK
jgi:hypothetical protein